MHYNEDVFMTQFPIAKRFVYHITYYRALYKVYRENDPKCEFWTHTIDAHLLQAAILWCMIFGTDGCNPTHWKNLSSKQSDKLKYSFRESLPKSIGIDWKRWQKYHEEMTDFRSKFAAHRELEYKKPIPKFDIALRVVYYYDHWIRKVIAPDIMNEPLLEESENNLMAIIPLINTLIKNTKEYYETAGGIIGNGSI